MRGAIGRGRLRSSLSRVGSYPYQQPSAGSCTYSYWGHFHRISELRDQFSIAASTLSVQLRVLGSAACVWDIPYAAQLAESASRSIRHAYTAPSPNTGHNLARQDQQVLCQAHHIARPILSGLGTTTPCMAQCRENETTKRSPIICVPHAGRQSQYESTHIE